VPLRFMFHYRIPPIRRPTSPVRLAHCPGAADRSLLEKIGDFWRFPATAAPRADILQNSPLFAIVRRHSTVGRTRDGSSA